MEKLADRSVFLDRPPPFLCSLDKDDVVVESVPRDMKLKWKGLVQRRSGTGAEFEGLVSWEDGGSNWPDLPMELLVQIMALVDHRTVVVSSGVCHAWREALHQGISDLSFSWCGRNVSKLVQSLATKFSKLQSCDLRRCPLLTDVAIEALGSNMRDLKVLDLTNGTQLTDSSLVALAKGCVRLEKLNLSGCLRITEVGVVALAESCRKLKHLNLCGCDNAASDKVLQALAENCSGIQYLNVGWCERITDTGVIALARGCSELRVVDLCGCHLITDISVMGLSDHCVRLRVLNLYRCQNITDLSMYTLADKGNLYPGPGRGIAKHLRGLKYTNGNSFSEPRSRTCSGSTNTRSNFDSITKLNQQSTTKGYYIETLVNDLDGYGLVSLNLSGCRALSAVAVQAVCNAYPALHTCPERCSLNISGCLNLTSVHCVCDGSQTRCREY